MISFVENPQKQRYAHKMRKIRQEKEKYDIDILFALSSDPGKKKRFDKLRELSRDIYWNEKNGDHETSLKLDYAYDAIYDTLTEDDQSDISMIILRDTSFRQAYDHYRTCYKEYAKKEVQTEETPAEEMPTEETPEPPEPPKTKTKTKTKTEVIINKLTGHEIDTKRKRERAASIMQRVYATLSYNNKMPHKEAVQYVKNNRNTPEIQTLFNDETNQYDEIMDYIRDS
jgi:hypothetical protein